MYIRNRRGQKGSARIRVEEGMFGNRQTEICESSIDLQHTVDTYVMLPNITSKY